EPGAMALVTLAETKVTRRKGARRPQTELLTGNHTAPVCCATARRRAAGELPQSYPRCTRDTKNTSRSLHEESFISPSQNLKAPPIKASSHKKSSMGQYRKNCLFT
ncbi:hypothetical protein, partial [Pseudomonas capsici]|uniref:hypothetical protein n=1 Tax=Pseudomonas capsici TaxID=2810614 RepID=UPI0021F148B6